jgi:putative toxin-antitoxin system antitoxin component (TIGR02293 family)
MATAASLDRLPRGGDMERVRAIESGLPVKTLRHLLGRGFTIGDVARVVAPRRTLERRLKSGGRLTVEESDRLARLSQAYDLAMETFDDPAETIDWLRSPLKAFDEHAPLDLLKTSAGASAVENLLQRALHGMLA